MDLKDLVISTLAEIEDAVNEEPQSARLARATPFVIEQQEEVSVQRNHRPTEAQVVPEVSRSISQGYRINDDSDKSGSGAELEKFLVNLKERVLVLFEGLQTIDSSNNKELLMAEKKMDLTINFLEYLLASIDEKLEHPSK